MAAYRSDAQDVAMAAVRAARQADPDLALAHKLLGIMLLRQPGQRDQALAHLRRALEIDPAVPDAERLRAILPEPAPGP